MPVMMIMQWAGVTREQYEAVRELSDFEGDAPRGGLFHIAALTDAGLQVTDLWERAEDFQAFVQSRLMPAVQKTGIQTEPQVQIMPVYNVFAPGYTPIHIEHPTLRVEET